VDGAWLTLISIPNSLRLHTPLPSWLRPKKKYCRADSSSFRIGVLSIFYTHPYAYTSFKMAQSPPSCRRPYQTSRRHPRTYILTSSKSSPRDTHLRIFSRLSTSFLTKAFTLALSTSTVTPTPTSPSDPRRRVTHPTIFSRLYTSILTFLEAVEPFPPTSPLHHHHFPIFLFALPVLRFSRLSTYTSTFT